MCLKITFSMTFSFSIGFWFQSKKKEVTLRRSIGPTFDKYTLNKEEVTWDAVVDLFKAAGLSVSSMFATVQQGKVSFLLQTH